MDDVVEDFYRLLLGHLASRSYFPDDATIRRVKRLQRDYFLQLRCDLPYVEDRLRVGGAAPPSDLPPRRLWPAREYCRRCHRAVGSRR